MTIGTSDKKQQKVSVLLDTGSFELWVNPDCDKSNVPKFCRDFGHYDPALSSTSVNVGEPFGIKYGSGNTEGTYYRDDIYINGQYIHTTALAFSLPCRCCWGPFLRYIRTRERENSVSLTNLVHITTGAQIKGQQFGVANRSDTVWFGIMGLAHGQGGSGFLPYPGIVDTIAEQKYTQSKLFSLDLGGQVPSGCKTNRLMNLPGGMPRIETDGLKVAETGQIVFGGVDKNKYSGNLRKVRTDPSDS